MLYPANSTMRAFRARCFSCSGVLLAVVSVISDPGPSQTKIDVPLPQNLSGYNRLSGPKCQTLFALRESVAGDVRHRSVDFRSNGGLLHGMSNPTDRSDNIGYGLAFASAFFSAVATVLGKWNLQYVSVLAMNGMIFTIATIVFSIIVVPRRGLAGSFRMSKQGWLWTILFAVTSWLAIWLFWLGVHEMDPSLASLLNRSEVLVAILLGVVFLKERFSRRESIGTLLALAGIIVMRLTLRFEYSDGFLFVLVGSVFFGITEFVSKIAVRHVDPTMLAFVRNSILALMYWVTALAYKADFSMERGSWIGIIALGLIGPVAARWIYLLALKRLDLSKVAISSQIQPAYVLLLAALFLGVIPTIRESVGGVLLLAGSLMLVSGKHRRNQRSTNRSDAGGV